MEGFKKELFELRNYNQIIKICDYAKSHSKFLIISGETGTGKTEGLINYRKKDFDNIKYVRLRKSMTTSNFFTEIASAYGYKFSYKTLYRFMNWIRDYIEENDEKQLLIIDEGGMFNHEQLSLIHELRDLTDENLGIILSGPKYFVEQLNLWNNVQKRGVPEFYRRVNRIIPLKDLTKEEIRGVCKAYNITSNSDISTRFLKMKTIGDLTNSIENYFYFKNNSKL